MLVYILLLKKREHPKRLQDKIIPIIVSKHVKLTILCIVSVFRYYLIKDETILLIDGEKKGIVRSKETLPVNEWVGIARTVNDIQEIVGVVVFNSPVEITKDSPEYKSALLDVDNASDGKLLYYRVIETVRYKTPVRGEFPVSEGLLYFEDSDAVKENREFEFPHPDRNLEDTDNAVAFKEWVRNLQGSPITNSLPDGTPQTALKWFEENMVGEQFDFYIPTIGYRSLIVRLEHFFKFICQGFAKGKVKKAGGDVTKAFEMIRNGEISSSDINGWTEYRARILPLMPKILREFDAAIFEENDKDDAILFLKKFVNRKGEPNVVVMAIVSDGVTIKPLSAHIKNLTLKMLKEGQLLFTSEGELYNRYTNNSTNRISPSGIHVESNYPEIGISKTYSNGEVNPKNNTGKDFSVKGGVTALSALDKGGVRASDYPTMEEAIAKGAREAKRLV